MIAAIIKNGAPGRNRTRINRTGTYCDIHFTTDALLNYYSIFLLEWELEKYFSKKAPKPILIDASTCPILKSECDRQAPFLSFSDKRALPAPPSH